VPKNVLIQEEDEGTKEEEERRSICADFFIQKWYR
jgi:hypothetical protein